MLFYFFYLNAILILFIRYIYIQLYTIIPARIAYEKFTVRN